MTRNKGAIKATNISNLRVTKASFFMPYAGFFTEAAERDSYVKVRNFKNSVDDFEKICTSNDSSLLNVNKEQIFVLVGSQLISRKLDETEKMSSSNFGLAVEYDNDKIDIQLNEVVLDYFESCNFKDDLLVDLRPTNDDFSLVNLAFKLDFSLKKYSKYYFASHTKSLEEEAKERGLRYLQIKVRKEELLDVIINGKPWEDLSIGFQCRIFRVPNVYNSEFWFHFTNVYVGKNIVRSALIRLNE